MSNLAHKIQRQHQQPTPKPYPKTKPSREPKKSPITKGEKVLYSLTFIGIVFAAYMIISNYASIYMVNKDIHLIERSINEQKQINEGLQLQVAELAAPDRILHIAQEELGMKLDENRVRVLPN